MNDLIKNLLPFIGTALLGPAGAGAATWVASKLGLDTTDVENVKTTLTGMLGNPEQVAKLKEIELEYAKLQSDAGIQLATLDAQIVEKVNDTIQVEAKSDHWPTYSWRPYIGFSFGTYIFSFAFLPLIHITPAMIPAELTLAVGGILGVTAWYRGKAQADPALVTDNRG